MPDPRDVIARSIAPIRWKYEKDSHPELRKKADRILAALADAGLVMTELKSSAAIWKDIAEKRRAELKMARASLSTAERRGMDQVLKSFDLRADALIQERARNNQIEDMRGYDLREHIIAIRAEMESKHDPG